MLEHSHPIAIKLSLQVFELYTLLQALTKRYSFVRSLICVTPSTENPAAATFTSNFSGLCFVHRETNHTAVDQTLNRTGCY